MNELDGKLINYAIELFCAADLTRKPQPTYVNRDIDTVLQAIDYPAELNICANNVSHVFSMGEKTFLSGNDTICFLSVELNTSYSSRSQLAYDVHRLLVPLLGCNGSIILFRSGDMVLLTMQGYDSDVYLSDWFDMIDDFDHLREMLDISNMKLTNGKCFFCDLVYSCARYYYVDTVSRNYVIYEMMPIDYYTVLENIADVVPEDRREYREKALDSFFNRYKDQYNDDYVESEGAIKTMLNDDIEKEMDALAAEIDLDDYSFEQEGDFEEFGDLEEDDDFEEEDNLEEEDDLEKDEAQLELEGETIDLNDIDDDIMNDPIRMLKFLEEKATKKTVQKETTRKVNAKQTPKDPIAKPRDSELAAFFISHRLEVVDQRNKGGCLWVACDNYMADKWIKIAENSFHVVGDYAFSKALGGRFGWYTKSSL